MDRITDFTQYYRKERQMPVNSHKTPFFYEPKLVTNTQRKFHGMMRTYMVNAVKTTTRINHNHDSATSSEQSLTRKFIRYTDFAENSQENIHPQSHRRHPAAFTSFRNQPKITYDETWLCNKQYNTRVAAQVEKSVQRKISTTVKRKSPKTSTYQEPNGKIVHERVYPATVNTRFCFRIAVNGASKSMRGELPLSNLNLSNGDFGDDAGMFMENRNFCFVGLADGAGGNRSFGINPADFSRAILASCRSILRQSNVQPNQLPRLILSAIQQVEASRIRGSSTLCLLALDKQKKTLTTLNIGDSGFVIYRNNHIYRRSKCTMNSNGCGPRQLFAVNGSLGVPCFLNENEVLRDCSLDTFEVQKDDIIILSSDGLWDVIQSDQLQQIVERNANKDLQDLADDLLSQAVEGYIANGRDDILVIVCRVDTV
ncbi:unnamed protein product [Adineta ricciae]|uniref:Protein phosphatase n=1 Tax=Adineta ricciae TaxID=249248 RepID=A0A814HUN4_ADIRI|nr:unnamed protein product [Adineta ricciae]